MAHVLTIDQSTSATKAIVFDSDGRVVEKDAIEHRQIYPRPGWVEHDAEEIWENTLAAIARVRIDHVKLLSITNQRETVVVFDRDTGKPLHNAIVWQCRRGSELCESLARAGHGETITAKTGLKLDTYFSASKVAWLIENRPEIAAKLRDGSALIGTIDAYLIYRLTRGATFATDHTNASRTLLFDINTMRWDENLCALFGVPMHALPAARDSTAEYGSADVTGAEKRRLSLPICGVMGDSQASLFAHRCATAGSAKVTIGTGSSILLNIGPEPSTGGEAAVTTVAWTHRGKATYCFEGIINYSAATIEWLRSQLQLLSSANETEAIARSVPDNGGVYLVPAFAGLSAPYWSPDARAAIVGLSSHSSRSHVVRAALESIAYQINDALVAMKQIAGLDLKTIHADGGATANRFVMQFIADMTGVKIATSDLAECSPLGAAMAGMLGMGMFGSIDDLAHLPRTQTLFEPQMAATEVERFLAGWRRAVQQVLAGV